MPDGPRDGSGNLGSGNPPSSPSELVGDDSAKPLRDRLNEFYTDKENYINHKRQCKEESAATNAPSGTCWNKLRPLMTGLLQKEIVLTQKRLLQLDDKNITIPNRADIDKRLIEAKAIFANSGSSKALIKSTAKSVEEMVNQIEDIATQNETGKLIKQMDNLMIKADRITNSLDAKLSSLKASGYNTAELEASLIQYK